MSLRVLIVEHDFGLRSTLAAALDGPHLVITAPDGQTGLLHAEWADVILLDGSLPGMDAAAWLQELRALRLVRHVILMSPRPAAGVPGILAAVPKPVNRAELERVLAHLPPVDRRVRAI